MSVNSTVTVLSMAKVGVSLSLTLVIIASELAFGKAGSFHQTWFQRDRKVLFKPSTSV